MLFEFADFRLHKKLNEYIHSEQYELIKEIPNFGDSTQVDFEITDKSFDLVIVQYRALGYIRSSNNSNYVLTTLGEDVMNRTACNKKILAVLPQLHLSHLEHTTTIKARVIRRGGQIQS